MALSRPTVPRCSGAAVSKPTVPGSAVSKPTLAPSLPTKIIPTKIARLKISRKFPIDMIFFPLHIDIMLESNPPRSRIL